MSAFLRRRSTAATEALVFALIAATVAALAGLTAMAERPGGNSPASIFAMADPQGQTLEGVLTIEPATEQPDGAHWLATLDTGEQVVSVRITHEDSHRLEIAGALVQVEGTWSPDGSFVAAAIDIVDPSTGTAPAKAASPGTKGPTKTLEGVIELRHGDDFGEGRRTVTRYFLRTDQGDTELAFEHLPAAALAGSRVRVSGVDNGRSVSVTDGGTTQVATGTVGTTISTGAKRLAVVLLNFSNDTSQPYAPSVANGVAFTNPDSVAAYYAESSAGLLSLSGDVLGWYTIPETNAGCAYSAWASSANGVAAAAGVDLTAYDNIVYAFPSTSCGWAGLAGLPGRTSWLNGPGAMNLHVMAHELGHNFGTHHASYLNCNEGGVRVPLASHASSCTSAEYGDPFTLMGTASRYQHSNFAKGNFSWLAGSNKLTVTSSGDYLLAPSDIPGLTSVTSLRVQRTTSTWFTMEFRQPYGTAFETYPFNATVATGVSVRLTPDYSIRSQSQLLDTTPGTTTFSDAPLAVGQTFVDPLTGASITTLSTSPAGALVRVSLAPGSPSPSPAPTASPTPQPTATPTPSPTPTSTPGPTATPAPGDHQAPTAPSNLTATIARSRRVSLTWVASSDNVKVVGYRVYRDGSLVATVKKPTWSDALTMSGGGQRQYVVVACDAAGNVSPPTALTLP